MSRTQPLWSRAIITQRSDLQRERFSQPLDYVCAHREWKPVENTDGGSYRRCEHCGLEEQVSPDTAESRFKDAQDEWHGGDDLACLTPFAMALSADDARYRVDILRTLVRPGRLLEIGPGTGHFAEPASNAGYDVVAIEDSAILAEKVRERGVTVIDDRFESAELESEPFDVIMSWHVIEHVLEPTEFLRHAARFAAPRATLIAGTPNASSWEHRLAGQRSFNCCLPHLRVFTDESLAEVFRDSGWNPVEAITIDRPDHRVKFCAAHLCAIRGADPADASVPALSVTTIDARRGMRAIRPAGAVTWLPRQVRTRIGRATNSLRSDSSADSGRLIQPTTARPRRGRRSPARSRSEGGSSRPLTPGR